MRWSKKKSVANTLSTGTFFPLKFQLTQSFTKYSMQRPSDKHITRNDIILSVCIQNFGGSKQYSFIYRLGRLRPSQDFGCFFGSRWDQRSQVQPVAKKSSQKSGCIVQPFGCMCAAIHAAKWLHKCSQMAACLQPKRIYLQPMSAAIWLHVCSHCAAMPKTCSPCAATVSSVQPMCSPCAAIPSCSNPDHARNT